ncbi:MAG: hypothetical protein AAFN07_11320 [Pseudomonadota bacterium]
MSLTVTQLLIPAALSALLAWIASTLVHLVIKYHNSDYKALKNEGAVADAIGAESPAKGIYTIPYCVDMKEMGSEEMQAKFAKGPVAFVTVFDNGMPKMGKLILQQIVYFFIGAFLIGYCASLAMQPGEDYLVVFRAVSAIAFLAYGWAVIPFSIWYGHLWSTCAKYLVDALIYALLTAGVYAWLWPAA